MLVTLSACKTVSIVDESTGVDLLTTDKTIYTLVNLHPDEVNNRLYSVNFQREGLIPACSKVSIDAVSAKRLQFTVSKSERAYTMDKHKSSPDFLAYLSQYFGTECVSDKIKNLSSKDRAGIKAGVVDFGMTKQGVIYAIGYPPAHQTSSIEADEWKYWIHRFRTMRVKFDSKGRVVELIK